MTGRWASSGGGALQLPRQLRAAVRADPGWRLVIADVAQLEPRVLAAMAGDTALADAARGRDLYAGIVDTGAVALRSEAKIAMLGAMYGATTGDSGRLVPRLRRTFPRAMALVDDAARTGENGGVVTHMARPQLPASLGELARRAVPRERCRGIRHRRDPRAPLGARPRQVHAQLRRAGNRRRVGARLDGGPARSPRGDAARDGVRCRTPVGSGLLRHGRTWRSSCTTRSWSTPPPSTRRRPRMPCARPRRQQARLLFGDFPIDFPLELRIAETAQKD